MNVHCHRLAAMLRNGIMQGNGTRFLLNLFVLLAFIGAGISPACKFISGGIVEICGPNGIETVLLSDDGQPLETPAHDTAKADQCAFCFTGSQIKAMSVASVEVMAPDMAYVLSGRKIAAERAYSAYRLATLPRGPPATV